MENENASKLEREVVSPSNIEEMTDEEFDGYIESAKKEEASGEAEPAEKEEPYMIFATKEELQAYQDKTIGKRLKQIRESGEEERKKVEKLYSELMNSAKAPSFSSESFYNQRVSEIEAMWRKEEEAIKNIDPDFDLEKALENPEFYKMVVEEKKTLAKSYPALKKKESRQVIKEVGSLSNGVSGKIVRDVASMSDKEFDDYIRRIKDL